MTVASATGAPPAAVCGESAPCQYREGCRHCPAAGSPRGSLRKGLSRMTGNCHVRF